MDELYFPSPPALRGRWGKNQVQESSNSTYGKGQYTMFRNKELYLVTKKRKVHIVQKALTICPCLALFLISTMSFFSCACRPCLSLSISLIDLSSILLFSRRSSEDHKTIISVYKQLSKIETSCHNCKKNGPIFLSHLQLLIQVHNQ